MVREGRARVAAATVRRGGREPAAVHRGWAPALAAFALLATFAATARAQAMGPTFLSWSGCSGSGSTPFDCAADGGSVYTVVGSFAVSDSVAHAVSMDVDLDVTFPTFSGIPDFWSIGLDGCSPSSLVLVKGA